MQREKRFIDAIRLEATDRVPLEFNFGYFPAKYCGIRYDAAYYDYDAWLSACKKTLLDFGADVSSVQPFFPGSVLELVDPRVVQLAGAGWRAATVAPDHRRRVHARDRVRAPDLQPHRFRPQALHAPHVGSDEGLRLDRADACRPTWAIAASSASPRALASPEVAASHRGAAEDRPGVPGVAPQAGCFLQRRSKTLGFPPLNDRIALAPYDVIADNLRGMRGIMTDLFKHPDEICGSLRLRC